MVELSPAIVLGVVSKLRSDISSLNSSLVFPGLSVSQLHHEGLSSVVFFAYNKSSHYDGVRSEATEISRPVFSSRTVRSVNHELISLFVKSGGSLEHSDVRAVTKLSLTISDPHLLGQDLRHPSGLLLFTSNVLHRQVSHCVVEADSGHEALVHVHPPVESRRSHGVILSEIFFLV